MDSTHASNATPLEDVAYLARSAHRVTALRRLAEGPMTRQELHAATDISQPTLGRLLEGFEERDWVACDRTDGRVYELTAFGHLVAEELDDLLTVVGTMQRFRAVADDLPLDRMDFDLRRFATADITVPSPTDATAHMRREDELIATADDVRFLCSSSFGPGIKAYRDRIVGSDISFEAVITGDALDAAMADQESAGWVRDLATADNVTLYRYDGPLDLIVGIIDRTVSLVPLDDSGLPNAFIETDDPAIREWAVAELGDYRDRAEPVTPGTTAASTSTP